MLVGGKRMNWIDPYTFLLTTLGLSVIFLSFALLRTPRKLSRTLLAIAAGLAGVFIILTVLELVISDLNIMIALRNIQQISLILTPIFLLGYAKELHQEASRKTIRLMCFLFIPSIMDIILVFTDSYHGLMRESVTIRTIWNYTEVSIQTTVLNSFLGVYPFVISVLTVFLLIRNMFDVPKHYRMTHWLSALVIALPLIIITTTSLLSFEVPGIFALSNCSMAMLLILVNKKMDFNVVWPVSRQEVLENLSEGILLIDKQGKIVEMNKASCLMIKQLFGIDDCQTQVIYQPVQSVFRDVTPLSDVLDMNCDTAFQFERDGFYFDVNLKILDNKSNNLRLIVWKDVTDKKQIEHQLKELAKIDSLTQLTNREAFIESYYLNMDNQDSCFMIMDIDHFKKFNDQYGHLVGDKVLKYVADLMKNHFSVDLVTRLGGEEFGVLLKMNVDQAIDRAKAFQALLKDESRQIDAAIKDEVTVSIGICAVSPGTPFEQVYQQADQAMYRVKHEGRDSIRVC
jgi:diguanylate cyclase